MEFGLLRVGLPPALAADVDELLARKALADERTTVACPAALAEFLRAELAAGQAAREALPVTRGVGPGPALDELFREMLAAAT